MNLRIKLKNGNYITFELYNSSKENISNIFEQVKSNITHEPDLITNFVRMFDCGNETTSLLLESFMNVKNSMYRLGFNFIIDSRIYVKLLNDDIDNAIKVKQDKGKSFLLLPTGYQNNELIDLGYNHFSSIQAFDYENDKNLPLEDYINNIEIEYNINSNNYIPLKDFITLVKMSCQPEILDCNCTNFYIQIYQLELNNNQIVTIIFEVYTNTTHLHSIHF